MEIKKTKIYDLLRMKQKTFEAIYNNTVFSNIKKMSRTYEQVIAEIESKIEDKESEKERLNLELVTSFIDPAFSQTCSNFINNQLIIDIEIHNLTVKLNYLKKARDYYFNEREAHNG